jgi:hypothetical protein
MNLNAFAAQKKRQIFDELSKGLGPSIGRFDQGLFRDAKDKAQPQMGTTRYTPSTIAFEFIYAVAGGQTQILAVELDSPERIVFLPVPAWIVETIWQGEIDGSFHFESDAKKLLAELTSSLEPEQNASLFEAKKAIGKA